MWDHVYELARRLDDLDGREVEVKVKTKSKDKDIQELAEAVAREFSKPGGPQISSRAISNR